MLLQEPEKLQAITYRLVPSDIAGMQPSSHQGFHDPNYFSSRRHPEHPGYIRVLAAGPFKSQIANSGSRIYITGEWRDTGLMTRKIMGRKLPGVAHDMHLSRGPERQMRWFTFLGYPCVDAYRRRIWIARNRLHNALGKMGAQQVVIMKEADVVRRCFGQAPIEVIEYAEIVGSATVLKVRKLRSNQRFHGAIGRVVGYDDFEAIYRLAHGGLNRLARKVRTIAAEYEELNGYLPLAHTY